MFGPPKPIKGNCNAHLYIGDDFGDNCFTAQCALPEDHKGLHKIEFELRKVIITWEIDEREENERPKIL